eukprot:COSAG01_NODE_145_length_24103_cov_41.178012_9_plen_207_part_00
MAWHSEGWSHALSTRLHPLASLDERPLRFARIVVHRASPPSDFDEEIAVVALHSGWERWRVSHLRQEAERLLTWQRQRHAGSSGGGGGGEGEPLQIAYLMDVLGGALYAHDLLGDLEIIPRRRAASVDLFAVLEGERPVHTLTPSADEGACLCVKFARVGEGGGPSRSSSHTAVITRCVSVCVCVCVRGRLCQRGRGTHLSDLTPR